MDAHELSARGARLLAEALLLPPEERVELADRLIFTLEPEYLRRVEEAWMKEAEARLDAYERGEMSALPSDLAIAMAKAAARKGTRRESPRRRDTE